MSRRTTKLYSTPVYAVHGNSDVVVPPVYSQLMCDGVNKNGGNANILFLDGLGHNDGIDCAYRNTDVTEWLLAQRRTGFGYAKEFCEDFFKIKIHESKRGTVSCTSILNMSNLTAKSSLR